MTSWFPWRQKAKPEVWWRKDRVMSRWDREAWEWRPAPGQPYTLTNWHRNKAHAESEANWDKLNIDCVSSTVTGPYAHKERQSPPTESA